MREQHTSSVVTIRWTMVASNPLIQIPVVAFVYRPVVSGEVPAGTRSQEVGVGMESGRKEKIITTSGNDSAFRWAVAWAIFILSF